MIYSIHSFQLSLECNNSQFSKLRNKSYYADCDLGDGIRIEYHDGTYKKKIKLLVNPNAIFDTDSNGKLWNPTQDNAQILIRVLNKYIERCFGSRYSLNDFVLTNISLAVNIDVGNREKVAAYINVLQNIGKVKGFSPMQYEVDTYAGSTDYFGLVGNTNGVEFIVFDKAANEQKKTFLCIEVRLVRRKTIRKYTAEMSTTQQLEFLSANSKEIFLDTFSYIVPDGDYYKKQEADKIILDSKLKRKSKAKMLRLLALIPKKKSLLLAQKEMNDRNIDKVMRMFEELHLSPVTISKRQDVNYLDTLYQYLVSE